MGEFSSWFWPILGSAIITAAVSFIVKYSFSKYFAKKEKEDDERRQKEDQLMTYKEAEHQRQLEILIRNTITDSTKILNEKIDNIQSELDIDKQATIINLRSIMKQLRDQYLKQGYADAGDVATWNQLYTNYSHMGGNSFKEFVDQWKEDVNNLPRSKPEFKITEISSKPITKAAGAGRRKLPASADLVQVAACKKPQD